MDIQLPEKRPVYQVINGLKFYPNFREENVKSGLSYKPKNDDIFIVTYPKCGTTWMQQICILLFHNGELPEILKTEPLYALSPFLESMGSEGVEAMRKPGAIKSHLPFSAMPYNPEAKYIYVARNPKDACVSHYHHTKLFKSHNFDGSFNDYLNCWLLGEVDSGSYAEHLLSWWVHRNDPNVLFILYEDMKEDIRSVVLKLADFIDPVYRQRLELNPAYMEGIVANSDISFMRETTNKTHEKRARRSGSIGEEAKFEFIRKGIIGDWKNHFTETENELMKKWFHEKFDSTGIERLWTKYSLFD